MPFLFRVTCDACRVELDVPVEAFAVHDGVLSVTWEHCDGEQSQPWDMAHVPLMLRNGAGLTTRVDDEIADWMRDA